MYIGNKIMEICKVDNGYIIELKVPLKAKSVKDMENEDTQILQDIERHLFKEDAKGIAKSVKKLLPLLEDDYKNDKDFEKAFTDAVGKAE